MNLVGKRKQFTDAKNIPDTNLTKQQKEQYTQVSQCVYVQNFTPKGTVYSSVKLKAITSWPEVDNSWV